MNRKLKIKEIEKIQAILGRKLKDLWKNQFDGDRSCMWRSTGTILRGMEKGLGYLISAGEREREKERERETNRQTDWQTDRQKKRQREIIYFYTYTISL